MNRRMKLIFTVSILLNIVFVGVGVGMFYKFCQDLPIAREMSPEGRNFVARTYQQGWKDVKPLIKEVKERKKKVEAILLADEFDEKAYDKAVEDVLKTQGRIMHHRAETMSKALDQLSTEDRKKFSRDILAGLTPGRKGGHRHHRGKRDRPQHSEERPRN
ncbi:MAG TPA: periplasmic heavy metal sensor [Micavibrio sp.]|nr:periplasmic heavy metal sensor [Micavibrio sp.]